VGVKPLAWMLLPVLLLSGCRKPQPRMEDATLALVNGEVITAGDLIALLPEEVPKPPGGKGVSEKTPEREALQRELLDQIIEKKILLQEARKMNLHLSQAEFKEKSLFLKNGMDEKTFSRLLEEQGLSKKDWERATRENLIIEKLLSRLAQEADISVAPEEVRAYYEAHREEWHVDEQLKLRQIIVETEEEAAAIRLSLLKGADFMETARIHSHQVHLNDEGGLGYLSRKEVPLEFDPLFQAEVGSISEVIKTPFGYHLVKVEGRRSARVLSFEETKEQISKALLGRQKEQAFSEWMKKRRKLTEVQINEALLKKIP